LIKSDGHAALKSSSELPVLIRQGRVAEVGTRIFRNVPRGIFFFSPFQVQALQLIMMARTGGSECLFQSKIAYQTTVAHAVA